MKNLIGAICLFFLSLTTSAAEINFLSNPTWSSVLEKAKKENKIIFLDAYATWCGPCKQMDAQIYTNSTVAEFYNATFINVKYDMEKGEGPMLAERYFVTAYPSLLFINSDGVILHKGIGFHETNDFVALGKAANDPSSQYFTLKKKALELSNADFARFASMAVAFEDEEFEEISKNYLAKQPDILGNIDLIHLIMNDINALPDEKTLAYIVANKAKIVNSGAYSADQVEQRLIGLTLGYGIYQSAMKDENAMDFESIKALLDKYVPEKSLFVYQYFRTQYFLEQKKTAEALQEFDLIIDNTPAKVDFEQLCNAMMSLGPILAQEGKLDAALAKFDAVKIPAKEAKLAYMKDFVKGIIHIKMKAYDKFKVVADRLIANPDTPENVKADLKSALEKVAQQQ